MGVSLLRKMKNQVSGLVILVFNFVLSAIQSAQVTSKCFGLALHFSPVLYHTPQFQTDFFKVNYLSLKKAEYDVKNYAVRVEFFFYRSRWITSPDISIILHIIRKPNSIIALLFIKTIF